MKPTIELDATDLRLLTLLQADCSLTNDALAGRAHV
jgi:DNA-binding Lrp family transcriptional regulator